MEIIKTSLHEWLELLKDKTDDEIRRALEECSREELIDNCLILYNWLESYRKTFNDITPLLEEVFKKNEEVKKDIKNIVNS